MRALSVPPVVPYKALEKFSKALYGTTGGTYSARVFRPVMLPQEELRELTVSQLFSTHRQKSRTFRAR